MRKLYIFGLVGLAALIIGLAFADQMTFTTYYPAPYGVYRDFEAKRNAYFATERDPLTDELVGKVGIGTTTPDATLQVTGTMKVFGSWTSKSANTVYQASTDGIVVCESVVSNTFAGYTDGNNPPATVRTRNAYGQIGSGITMPVKKGDYWKVTASGASYNIYWIPLGLGN